MYTFQELSNMSVKELQDELEKSRKDLYKEKTLLSVGQSKTPHKARELKKYIAQLLTGIHNK